MSKHILSHYDPAVKQMQSALELAKSTGASSEVINSIQRALDLVSLREKFTHNATSQESLACKNIVDQTYAHDWKTVHEQGKTTWNLKPVMMSGPLEGQFLKSLVSMQKAKRVLDIGTFTGYSALSMAEALPADGEVVTIDLQDYLKEYTGSLLKQSPHHGKVKILIGQATEIMSKMAADGEKFDMMFLDAVKSEYKDYLKIGFEDNLLSPGGTILVDNAYLHGDGYLNEDGPTKKFVDIVNANSSLHSVLVPIRDGVMMIRRKSEVEGQF